MKYQKNWDGMTQIYPTEGSTAIEPQKSEKVIQVECFRPRKQEPPKKARKRRVDPELIRVTLEVILVMIVLFGILAIDSATDLFHTAVVMAVIIGCSGIIYLLEKEEP